MKGIDWLAQPKQNQFRIYLEYMRVNYNKIKYNARGNVWIIEPEDVYLKFRNRNDDFEYFGYLCRIRPYEDIWDYFSITKGFQDYRFESSIGLFN